MKMKLKNYKSLEKNKRLKRLRKSKIWRDNKNLLTRKWKSKSLEFKKWNNLINSLWMMKIKEREKSKINKEEIDYKNLI